MDEERYFMMCKHDLFKIDKENNFCIECGSVTYKGITALKPIYYNYKIEINPKEILRNMMRNSSYQKKYQNKFYLSVRGEIIPNLLLISNKLKFSRETFYLAIFYMDRIGNSLKFEINFELVGVCCVIIAGLYQLIIAKFNENDPNIPEHKDIINIYPKTTFSVTNLKKYEFICLKILGYKLSSFSSYHFLLFFSNCGYIFPNDFASSIISPNILLNKKKSNSAIPSVNITIASNSNTNDDFKIGEFNNFSIEKIYEFTLEIVYYFIEDNLSISFRQLHIACSCIAISREVNRIRELWPYQLEKSFNIRFEDFKKCYEAVKNIVFKKKSINLDFSSYLSHRQPTNLNNSALTPTIPPSVPKKSIEFNKLSNNLGAPVFKKKNTFSAIKPHSGKLSIRKNESNLSIQKDNKLFLNKNFKIIDKDYNHVFKSKKDTPKSTSINLAFKKVYNSNNIENLSISEYNICKFKDKQNYSSNKNNRFSVILADYQSNENKEDTRINKRKIKPKKLLRKNGESCSSIIYDLSQQKDTSLINISFNQISNSNSGILNNRSARLDMKNYHMLNSGNKVRDLKPQMTSRAENRKFSFNKLENYSANKNCISTHRQTKIHNYNKIPKSLKIDLNDIGSQIIKR